MNPARVRVLNTVPEGDGPVVYWMSRDMRAEDNWALLHAQERALGTGRTLMVVFCLAPQFLGATMRQYDFMLCGLEQTAARLAVRHIPLVLLEGRPVEVMPGWLAEVNAGLLVTDFDPLRIKRQWKEAVTESAGCAVHEVDAHNVVPCWVVSNKQEFAAYTIRPKITKKLGDFLDAFPALRTQPEGQATMARGIDWQAVRTRLKVDEDVGPVDWLTPGSRAGKLRLRAFIREKLDDYDESRNDPNADGQSELSPYLHFGQLSAQRVALEVQAADVAAGSGDAYLEELIVRRELSDNFCYYNQAYDTVEAFPDWAKESHVEHGRDPRPHTYTLEEFEQGGTHDALWNAAQRQMVVSGKMHGYLRMYWAKKILEWTKTPAEALRIAIRLNDRYELDGRDPNGYAGIAWSIGGVHDRAWPTRPVFGKVRCMTYNGCKGKFDVRGYIERWSE